jgi:pimeloyl-ACP methyl ester carboxylesterase
MRLACRSAGNGGRPLLLLHGLAGSSGDFLEQLDALARRGFHAVAPDLRGHGDSPRPEGEPAYELRALAVDVAELADDIGWSTFAVFGHELGGVVAQELALDSPDRIEHLVLQSTAPGPLPFDRNLAQGGIVLVRGAGSVAPLNTVHATLGVDRVIDCARDAYAALGTALLDAPDRSLVLSELRVPTLVLAGGDDEAFVDAAADLAAVIPHADLGIVPGCGHDPHVDDLDVWLVFIAGFLATSTV